jgi:hypothetical protein
MNEDSEMNCSELAEVAAELALGVLTGRERALALAHLENCEACREDVRQLMVTGDRLLELLPSAEPPAGFETRVLARLGVPAPAGEPAQPLPGLLAAGAGPRPLARRAPFSGFSGGRRDARDKSARGRTDRGFVRRQRRSLSVAAAVLAIAVAGLGGWRIGFASAPAVAGTATHQMAAPLASASLVTTAHENVGQVFLYWGNPGWAYMSIDMDHGSEWVTCELVRSNGQVTTLGQFQLVGGYGAWGSPNTGDVTNVTGARLLSATGTILATATFHRG